MLLIFRVELDIRALLDGIAELDSSVLSYYENLKDLGRQLQEGKNRLEKERASIRELTDRAIKVRKEIHTHHITDRKKC